MENKDLTKIFKALSDKNRLKILSSIYEEECKCRQNNRSDSSPTCIKDLSKLLYITVPTISYHIKELINADLITTEKNGRWVHCRINQKTLQKVCEYLKIFFNR